MGRIDTWAEAAEAVADTTAHTIRAAIHIRADHTDHPVLRTGLQALLTDRRDPHTGPRVHHTHAIPAVHTGPEAEEASVAVEAAEEAA